MPTRAKPSQWKTPGIEVFGAFDLRKHNVEIRQIVAGVPALSKQHRERLAGDMLITRANAHADVSLASRPLPAQKLAAIKKLRKLAGELSRSIAALDSDTFKLLTETTVRRDDTLWMQMPFAEEVHRLRRLRLRLYCAQKFVERRKSGRPRRDDIREAVISLLEDWDLACGREPTLGQFLPFVRAVLQPIFGDADFEGYCRTALYG